jgi:hypothetical protein
MGVVVEEEMCDGWGMLLGIADCAGMDRLNIVEWIV